MNLDVINTEVVNETLELKIDVLYENGSKVTFEIPCMEMTHDGWKDLVYDSYHPKIVELIDSHKPNWTPALKDTFKKNKELEYSKMMSMNVNQQIPDEEINAILASI